MKELMVGGAAAALAAGAWFHGPLQSGEIYDRPAAEVYRIVEASPLPAAFDKMVYAQRGGSVTRGGTPAQSMIWYFHANGFQVARYTVDIAAAGDRQSRVSTRFEMTDAAENALGKGFAIKGADQYEVIGRASMDEQIDARLDGRNFDYARISDAMSDYIVANMGQIQGEAIKSMDEAAARFAKADEQRAYSKAQADNAKFTPGEPMVR